MTNPKYIVQQRYIEDYEKAQRQKKSIFLRWLKKVCCFHNEWEVEHPDPAYLLREEGEKPAPSPAHIVPEGRWKPVAILKCTECDKKRYMDIDKFEDLVKWDKEKLNSLIDRIG